MFNDKVFRSIEWQTVIKYLYADDRKKPSEATKDCEFESKENGLRLLLQ